MSDVYLILAELIPRQLKTILGFLSGATVTTTASPTTTTKAATTTGVNLLNAIGGLLFGTPSTTTGGLIAGTTAPPAAAVTTSAVTAAPGPLATLVGLLQGLTAGGNSTAPSAVVVNSMLSVLAGNSTTLPLAEVATLLGLQPKTIPNPMTDPLGFITHPLIAPILLAAVTGIKLVYFTKYFLNLFLHVRIRAFLKNMYYL
jgi:hypothetical protein